MSSDEINTHEEDLKQCTPEGASSQESDGDFLPCSTDAGHNRFCPPRRLSEADENSFHCEQCDVNFFPKELMEHFNNHRAFEKCQYCEHSVYKYIVNRTGETKIYHTCLYETEELPSPASPDVNMNV